MPATTNGLPSSEPTGGYTGECTLGNFSLPMQNTDASLRALLGECTLGSFPLPSMEHRRRHTCSLHPNLQADAQVNVFLVVFLYQARNTDASLRAPLILGIFVPLIVFLGWRGKYTSAHRRMRSKPDHHPAVGLTPAWSRRIQSVDGSYPHFRSLPSSQLL